MSGLSVINQRFRISVIIDCAAYGTQPFFRRLSMFKQVVPVLSLILLAGPVFAADTTPPADQSAAASTTKSTTTKKHHSGKKHHKAATTDSSAPK
jgi:hypothetical protein